ncbi:undecaprenyl/decaprenyl-phosphate alpha-N-acetylglucosaminyl 1-phosphate transferase [Subsaximicrobium wynnwilliamsii]|uniref:Undecaprenyl/decaprenyl-phosphate alpha-N-acetylglucosaminyl 1-phosphate transferase n=1 Tax=Subsaximicrobium wynnwilliamsii TaxID=291179 RepID=A0A5C6ZJ55_9FLAO|nr:MraY family glycosyltransferase [Subsaximicrobium wynnwilliamsii]TXD83386.1 undecaprenyl/decaprenyl-phosphate alpha-N-acetylglucosaminyl 1-phosphate transferase [Subsaximicrobium wynnwilliamsii]TXD89077.1 undecaprenyl/decaprenyl-phosphate alpha-N-acetylglucosaminyl 1-phosphate transferase [Subsaximicrobium wynnwilliamsii]TXE03410.1 undecaprenyl/decaprenyl-phosphate alpha-N-acetylglucosaminyl 1-phosphate transferase [Subsaximicrobium wynnwilliamsii]
MIQEILNYFNPLEHLELWLILAFFLAFMVSMSTFPAIFNIAEAKHLMDEPGDRSIHSVKTPTLGGVGIFISLVVVITMLGGLLDTKILLLILGSLTILFFLGLKDDLLILSPTKKLFGQFLAAMLLIIFTDTRILGLSGLFGVTIMPYWVSVAFTLFVYLLVINAYNLIDGVDGLAGCLALLGSGAFAFIAIKIDDVTMSTVAVGTVGALIPFLRLNFSKHKKIFMGDTGSMIIGFLLAFFAVRFIGSTQSTPASEFSNSAPIMVLAILFFPLLDTFRIFMIRLVLLKKSPFSADNNHLHHRFLGLGFSHVQTTMYIVILNLMLVAFAYAMRDFDIHYQFMALALVGMLLYSVLFIYNWLMIKGGLPQLLNAVKNYKL